MLRTNARAINNIVVEQNILALKRELGISLIFPWIRVDPRRQINETQNFVGFSTGHLPRCQIGLLAGLLSTSHFRLTDIPSTIGIPKPGKRVIANDGVSETGIKQLASVPPTSMRNWRVLSARVSRETLKKKATRILFEYRSYKYPQIGLNVS